LLQGMTESLKKKLEEVTARKWMWRNLRWWESQGNYP
jgi:hypothetical protein